MSTPNTSTLPPLALTSEETTPIRVDLPAPLGPSRAKKSPGCTLQRDALERLDAVVVGLAQVSTCRAGTLIALRGDYTRQTPGRPFI